MSSITIALIALVAGVGLGYVLRVLVLKGIRGSMELEVKRMMISAKEEAAKIVEEAKKEATGLEEEAKKISREKESEWKKTEDRLVKKEELLDSRQNAIDKETEILKDKGEEMARKKEELTNLIEKETKEFERIAGLSRDEAKSALFSEVEKNMESDILLRMQKLERDGVERLDRKAKDILATSIQRLASATNAEIMTSAVAIPSDDVKGKIIGKEGRNIRAFERAAGVEVIVDDTPGAIVISSFDPVRRQIARVALENLILDGRIQPAKIEELVEKAKEEINKIIKQKGEQAAYECGVFNLDPRVLAVLGRLYFRTSYGQNVLQHSIEMTHIARMLAEELGADSNIAAAGALVHDIGKALDHEVQGTHIDIGMRILEKFGTDKRIIDAMKSHHEDYPYETIESIIVQTADAISGGRPGARRDSVENYLKRLSDLEAIAKGAAGVEKAYALSAGREIRIFVTPEKISDIEALNLAREVANRIEKELKYPGEIKITVIRETRVIEYAR